MWVKNFLFGLDYFAVKPELLFLNKAKHPSWIGLLLTITMLITTVTLFMEFSSNMINHENPFLSFTNQYHSLPKSIEIPAKSFNLIVGLVDLKTMTVFKDPGVFKLSLNIVTRSEKDNQIFFDGISLGVRECRSDDVKSFINGSYFASQDFSNLLCAAKSDETASEEFSETEMKYKGSIDKNPYAEKAYILEGDISSRKVVYLEFRVLTCSNSTASNLTCKPLAQIRDILQNTGLLYGLSSNSFDPRDYKEPFKPMIQSFIINLSEEHTQTAHHNVRNIKLTTDDGYFVKKENSVNIYKVGDPIYAGRSNVNRVLFEMFVFADRNEDTYYRSYDKIPDVLARVNGVVRVILLVIMVCFKGIFTANYYLDSYDMLCKFIPEHQMFFKCFLPENKSSLPKQQPQGPVHLAKKSFCSKFVNKFGFTRFIARARLKSYKIDISKRFHDLGELLKKLRELREDSKIYTPHSSNEKKRRQSSNLEIDFFENESSFKNSIKNIPKSPNPLALYLENSE